MVASLHAGLTRILDEGLEQVWARHEEAGRLLQDGLEEMELELFAQEGYRLPDLTTVRVPDGVDSAAVRGRLLERHGIEIGSGVGAYADTVWRIGLMGHNARPDAALLVLSALKETKFALSLAKRGKVPLPFPPHVARDVEESRKLYELVKVQGVDGAAGIVQGEKALGRVEHEEAAYAASAARGPYGPGSFPVPYLPEDPPENGSGS